MPADSIKLKMPLLVFGALLFLAASLWVLRVALAPFFAAVVFTYLLWPAFSFLNRRIRKSLSALTVVFCGLAAAFFAAWALIALFEGQAERVAASFPEWKEAIETKLLSWLQNNPWILEKFKAAADAFDPMVFLRGISGAGLGVFGWLLQALSFALVPLIAYYMLMDGAKWMESLESVVPVRFRAAAREMAREINERL